jgi:hypothetical protein
MAHDGFSPMVERNSTSGLITSQETKLDVFGQMPNLMTHHSDARFNFGNSPNSPSAVKTQLFQKPVLSICLPWQSSGDFGPRCRQKEESRLDRRFVPGDRHHRDLYREGHLVVRRWG